MINYFERKSDVTELQCIVNDRFVYYRSKMVEYYSRSCACVQDVDRIRKSKNHTELSRVACEIEVALNRKVDGLKSDLMQLDIAISDVEMLLNSLPNEN